MVFHIKPLLSPIDQLSQWALLVFVLISLISAITDFLKGKIFNVLVFPLMLFGLLLSSLQTPSLWWISILSMVLAFSIFLPLVIMKIMGAGDAKLTMALATILGLQGTWELFYYSILIASAGALVIIIRKKRLKVFFKELKLMFLSLFYKELQFHWPKLDRKAQSPFGVTIFFAFMVLIGGKLHVP